MKFDFSKKEHGLEYTVSVFRISNSGTRLSFRINGDEYKHDPVDMKNQDLILISRNYDSRSTGNEREDFDALFPREFKSIARIIGITNHLAHYFVYYSDSAFSDQVFAGYMDHVMGFTFLDWEEVAREKDNQLLYLTTEEETNRGREYLTRYYEDGDVIRLDFEIGEKVGCTYCLDSIILDREQNEFMCGLKRKINSELIKKFPG